MGTAKPHQGPLAALSQFLRQGRPPLLSCLVSEFRDAEDYHEFLRLVREYLPDIEEEITGAGPPAEMMAAFCRAFGERYFILMQEFQDGEIEEFGSLVQGIPVAVEGWDYEDYDELPQCRTGMVLASLLVDLEEELAGLEWEGIRITVMGAAAEHVAPEVLERVKGYPLSFLEEAGHQGLLSFAKMLCCQTGTVFWDLNPQEFYYPTSSGSACQVIDWSREAVTELTEEWERAVQIGEEVDGFLAWLEEDSRVHFARMVRFLEGDPSVEDPEQSIWEREMARGQLIFEGFLEEEG